MRTAEADPYASESEHPGELVNLRDLGRLAPLRKGGAAVGVLQMAASTLCFLSTFAIQRQL